MPHRKKAVPRQVVIDVLLTIASGDPAELDCDELELHADIELVLGKALAKTPAARFQTARELVEAIRAVPAVESARATPVVTSRDPGASSTFDDALQGTLNERGVADIIRDIQTSGARPAFCIYNGTSSPSVCTSWTVRLFSRTPTSTPIASGKFSSAEASSMRRVTNAQHVR